MVEILLGLLSLVGLFVVVLAGFSIFMRRK